MTFYSLGPSIQFNLRSMTSDKETNFMTTQYKAEINFAQIIKNIDFKHYVLKKRMYSEKKRIIKCKTYLRIDTGSSRKICVLELPIYTILIALQSQLKGCLYSFSPFLFSF